MQTYKPGSVLRFRAILIIYLGLCSRTGSISLPAIMGFSHSDEPPDIPHQAGIIAYLAFQLVRFALHLASLHGRWALTPPFHPYLLLHAIKGGIFSVALSVFRWCGTLPVRKYDALCCPDFPPS
jgi:hypothetical protein